MSNIGVNKVILIGNAGQDVEAKSTPGGKIVANFSLAVNEDFRNKTGTSRQRVGWVRCVAWNNRAEIAGKYISRGRLVHVEGRLQTRQYGNRKGREKTVCEAVVTTLRGLGDSKSDGLAHSDGDALPAAAAEAQIGDIPF